MFVLLEKTLNQDMFATMPGVRSLCYLKDLQTETLSHDVSSRDELAAVDGLINELHVAGRLLAFRMFGNTSAQAAFQALLATLPAATLLPVASRRCVCTRSKQVERSAQSLYKI